MKVDREFQFQELNACVTLKTTLLVGCVVELELLVGNAPAKHVAVVEIVEVVEVVALDGGDEDVMTIVLVAVVLNGAAAKIAADTTIAVTTIAATKTGIPTAVLRCVIS